MDVVISTHRYGSEAQAALAALVDQCKTRGGQRDPLAPVTIVVPSAEAGYHIRRVLGRRGSGVVNVQVKPLRGLMELIGSTPLTNSGRRPLPDVRRHEATREVAESGPPVFGDVPIEGGVMRTLTQRFAEFDSCEQGQLDTIAQQGGIPAYLIDRYRAYLTLTSEFYSLRDLAISATAVLPQQPSLLRDIGTVIIYLPGDLTAAEQAFVNALAAQTRVEVLLGLTGDENGVDRHALEVWGVDQPPPGEGAPTADQIVQSPDAEEEVRSVIRDISASLLSDTPTPLHRSAILYRQSEPYQRICAEQLAAAGIVWNGRNSETLGQSIAGRTLNGLLGLMSDASISWAADIAPWLSAAPIRAESGRLAPIARWNQLARRANLQRDPEDWAVRLQRYRAACADDLERLQRDADENKPGRLPWIEMEIEQVDELSEFTAQLVSFAVETPTAGRWSDYADRIRAELARLLGGRQAFGVYAAGDDDLELARWDDVQALLTELSWLDDLGQATAERFAAAARHGLERQPGHHGRYGDGVYVGPLNSAAGLHWDVVYIVGAAEKSLPQIRLEDPLISDQIRAQASLPGASDHLRRERADYLTALCSAERRVLSYPRADVREQRSKLPGRWLLESASRLNRGERIYASSIDRAPGGIIRSTPSFEGAVLAADIPADVQEFDLRSIRRSEQPAAHFLSQAVPSLERGFVQHGERWTEELTQWDGLVAAGAASAAQQPHSAGALQDWAACPYRYFLGRVLRIDERDEFRDEWQISALDKGSLIHEILERFFELSAAPPSPHIGWSQAERDRLAELADELLDNAAERGLTGHELLWTHERRRILNDLQTLLEQDDAHRNAYEVAQVGAELVFGELPGSKAPVSLTLDDGSIFNLRGVIDRIDRAHIGDRLIVIDYKTGREYPTRSELDKDVVVRGRSLQLPIYAHAARAVYGLADDATVQSAFWFITERGEFKFNQVDWDAEHNERFRQTINLIVENIREGRFPQNPGVSADRGRGANCNICSFDAICPDDRRRHWNRIKRDPQLADYVKLAEGTAEDEEDEEEAGIEDDSAEAATEGEADA